MSKCSNENCGFDLKRMKEALKGPSVTMPPGLTREEQRKFIENAFKK